MKRQQKRYIAMIGVMACIIFVIVGIGAGQKTAQKAERSRVSNSHMEMAKKYMEELAYEQAIAEYMAALEIEPENQEILDVLEQLYLDMAQQYKDETKYEEAIGLLEVAYGRLHMVAFLEKKETIEEEKKREKELQEERDRWNEAALREEEKRRTEEEKEEAEKEKERRKHAEDARKEFLKKKQKGEENIFGIDGDDLELSGYKKKAIDFIISVVKEQWEDCEDAFYACQIEMKENSKTNCRFLLAFDNGGKPLDCFEVEINKETGEGCIINYYGCDMESDGSLQLYESSEDQFCIVGRGFQ